MAAIQTKEQKTLAVFMEMGEWYVKHRRGLPVQVIHEIGTKYFTTDEDYLAFLRYMRSPEGIKRFRFELRDRMRSHGISLPPEEEWLPSNIATQQSFIETSAKLAEAQRDLPEKAMLRIQHSQIAQLYGHVAEHVGDISHRMTAEIKWVGGNYGTVREKVTKTLRSLRHRYGFEKDFKEQIKSNLRYDKEQGKTTFNTYEEALAKLKELGQAYADEHKKLVAANEAQRVARDAAVAVGEFRFDDAIRNLEILEAVIDKGEEAWNKFALQGMAAKTTIAHQSAQTYVTITDPGKTTFTKGAVISPEAFAEENKRVRERGEKEATGWTGKEGELPDNGNGANEEEFQLRTMRTLESVVRDTTVLASSRYIVKVLDSWDKAAKKRYLKAYLDSDWRTIYDLTSDLTGSGYSRSNTRAQLADVLKEHLGEFSPKTTKVDLRKDYDEKVTVPGGTLYRKGSIIQVWWDKWGSETWSHPWVTEKEAIRNFYDMQERWSCVEPRETIPQAKSNLTRQDVEVYMSLPPFRVSIWVEPKNPDDLRNIAKWDDDEARKWFEGMQTREQVEEAVLDHLENTGVLIKATPETKIKKKGDRGPEPVRRARKETDLQFLSDSPEFLANTIEQTGWRGQLDREFQLAIARTR